MTNESIQYQFFILIISILSILGVASTVCIGSQNDELIKLLEYFDIGVCMIFLYDFVSNFYHADNKLKFLKWGWVDLLASIPQVEVFRFARLSRILKILVIFRTLKSSKIIIKAIQKNKRSSLILAISLVTLIAIIVGSILILKFESSHVDSNIKDASSALWWSFVTITTVGYGDFYPVSFEGRIIAVFLMIVGIGLFSSLSGFIVSSLLDQDGDGKVDTELDEMKQEIIELKKIIQELTSVVKK